MSQVFGFDGQPCLRHFVTFLFFKSRLEVEILRQKSVNTVKYQELGHQNHNIW